MRMQCTHTRATSSHEYMGILVLSLNHYPKSESVFYTIVLLLREDAVTRHTTGSETEVRNAVVRAKRPRRDARDCGQCPVGVT